jgi:CelD/BcsL family acetyltransferase involved in cellulose biosynthesis
MRLLGEAELIVEVDSLRDIATEWDALAVACGEPQMSPAWIEPWWRYLAPPQAKPRVVAVREGERLIGLAPFFVDRQRGHRVDYRLSDIRIFGRLSPLATPGREWEVAATVARALAQAHPGPDLLALEALPLSSAWPVALRDQWPSQIRPILSQYLICGCPTVSLGEGSFEDWFAAKSSNFRGQMRRLSRRFEADGGVARTSTPATLGADVEAFVRLHGARWEGRGESNLVAFGERLSPMLREVGERLLDSERFRMRMLEIDGEPISAQLFLAAGSRVLYVNGGWDERFARHKPHMLGLFGAIEDAFAQGEQTLDLGLGEQQYKLRFSDGNDPVAWNILMVPSRRLPLTWARTAPMLMGSAARDAVKRGLSPAQADRLRELRDRIRR